MKTKLRPLISSLLFLCFSVINISAQLDLTPDKPDGVYKTGETVSWTVKAKGLQDLDSLRYRIKAGGLTTVDQGLIHLVDSTATIQYTFDAPGSVLLKVYWGKKDHFFRSATGGAVADPDQLKLSSPRPLDFKSFWEEKISELESVPLNARLEKVETEVPGVDFYDISMDNIRGSHIQGQLARPTEGETFPALLIVQWAGVYPLQKEWAEGRAREGWLVLNISAHDIPIREDSAFYADQSRGPLKNYPAIGNDDKETSYFLRMYLSCYRAANYLSQRSDWNGETLVVTGDSQGGLQAIMTAGFYPGITACVALVPAGFDMLGPDVGRKGGWPQWYNATKNKDPEKVHEASRYYDVANFVPDIKCPVLVGVGLLDETCPPEGIIAGLNQLKGPKEVMLLPNSAHQNRNGGQIPYQIRRDEAWFPALKAGDLPGGIVPLVK